jgi:hypothetical protein
MAANPDRGEVDVRLGGITRTLRFRIAELIALEEMLKEEAFSFAARNRSPSKFLHAAILCGISHAEKKITPKRVESWLDEFEGDKVEVQKAILYAISRGKPGEEGRTMIKLLDEAFGSEVIDENVKSESPPKAG